MRGACGEIADTVQEAQAAADLARGGMGSRGRPSLKQKQDRPLKTFAEHLRRVRWPKENEVYIRESGPWGPRVRCTDRYRVTTSCPEMLG
jgi:hypothetical protein